MDINTLILCTFLGFSASGCTTAQTTTEGQRATSPVRTDLEALEFQAQIGQDNAVLLDVRTPAEYASGHLAGSVNMDWSAADYEAKFAGLDTARTVLVYCAMGGRSDQAKEYLVGKGYHVIQLVDGISGWKKAGLPVVKE